MCGAWRTKACPPLATWAEYAPKPVLPVKLLFYYFVSFLWIVIIFDTGGSRDKWEDIIEGHAVSIHIHIMKM